MTTKELSKTDPRQDLQSGFGYNYYYSFLNIANLLLKLETTRHVHDSTGGHPSKASERVRRVLVREAIKKAKSVTLPPPCFPTSDGVLRLLFQGQVIPFGSP